MSIRELFRQKLENAEIIPGASVSAKLMKKVARREFLRFNPARFNIYYLGGLLVAGISAAIILYSGNKKSDQQTISNSTGKTSIKDSIEYVTVPAEQIFIHKSDKLKESPNELPDNQREIRAGGESIIKPAQNGVQREDPIVVAKNITDSFSKKGLFEEVSPSMNKLKNGRKDEDVLFEPSATEGCLPLKIGFQIKTESYDSCKWTFGDGGYSFDKHPVWIFDVEGTYNVVLNLFDSDGSQAIYSTIIRVHPKPIARFECVPEKSLPTDNEVHFYNYSTNSIRYKWDFGDGDSSFLFEPRHKYSRSGNFDVSLVVYSDYGCSDSLFVKNAFSGSEDFIDFPNAFIPNIQGPTGGYYSSKSDESAYVFHPSYLGVSDFQLKIFSKIGILIFESNDINLGWDGYFKGQLCEPGVYIWKVRGSFRNGEPFTKMGDVTLLRN